MLIVPLNGTWMLRKAGDIGAIPAAVPGDVHSALLAVGNIPDPYLRTNENDVQWVGENDWIFERTIAITADVLARPSVTLCCDGLDTFADISLNGQPVGQADNMHRAWRFEIKPLLHVGDNRISIHFRSAQKEAAARAEKLTFPVSWSGNNRIAWMNLIRKAQCHAGWDWGICLMVAGIYRDIRIEAADVAAIRAITTTQDHGDNVCTVTAVVSAFSPRGGECDVVVTLNDERRVRRVRLQPGDNRLEESFTVTAPRLWWPNGYGAQPLYPLTVTLDGHDVKKRLGLRRLEVISVPDAAGQSLVVRVNGVDVFCKGANWIPCDALPAQQMRSVIDDLLSSAVAVHMNMVRVWGGGNFESDDFYDLCDEKGLLIWHDMMFACSLYPSDPAFLASVRAEVLHQVTRLRDHASLALWCGDNECLQALGWYLESKLLRDRYLVNYDRLNQCLALAVAEADPTRLFWPSSPGPGPRGIVDDEKAKDPTLPPLSRGDVHAWQVWHGGKPFSAYYDVNPRFCSEFGFQSFPSLDAVRAFCPSDQWNPTSPVMEHHQRNNNGNALITSSFARYFRLPNGFAATLYLSQVQQALAIKTAVEYWRHQRPLCMGALYWQLNDNWPVASWSSLEHGGKWKHLHHHARRFFAPVITCALPTKDGNVELWVINDTADTLETVLRTTIMGADGSEPGNDTYRVNTPARAAQLVAAYELNDLLGVDRTARVLLLDLDARSPTATHHFRNEFLASEPKRYDLPQATVTAAVGQTDPDGAIFVTVTCDKPAYYVWLNVDGVRGEFDDNSFVLMPEAPRTMRFVPKQPNVTPDQVRAALTIMHLRASY